VPLGWDATIWPSGREARVRALWKLSSRTWEGGRGNVTSLAEKERTDLGIGKGYLFLLTGGVGKKRRKDERARRGM